MASSLGELLGIFLWGLELAGELKPLRLGSIIPGDTKLYASA